MSADNGYIIRVRDDGKYILQMYFASNDEYPDINAGNATVCDSLDEAVRQHAEWNENGNWSEYGLTIDLSNESSRKKKEKTKTMETQKFVRLPITVEGVQVTDENMSEVALWSGGTIETDDKGSAYIHINVKFPISPRQTKAFVNDWVLKAKGGFKIYTENAFPKSFLPDLSVPQQVIEEAQAAGTITITNVFGQDRPLNLTEVDAKDQISGKS